MVGAAGTPAARELVTFRVRTGHSYAGGVRPPLSAQRRTDSTAGWLRFRPLFPSVHAIGGWRRKQGRVRSFVDGQPPLSRSAHNGVRG
jgi:hypothetical protein